eukprot:Hpha_TRINITY_DN15922_c1_g1::TRINITY_DN15922_c1_g1_i3::g.71590::m.71590
MLNISPKAASSPENKAEEPNPVNSPGAHITQIESTLSMTTDGSHNLDLLLQQARNINNSTAIPDTLGEQRLSDGASSTSQTEGSSPTHPLKEKPIQSPQNPCWVHAQAGRRSLVPPTPVADGQNTTTPPLTPSHSLGCTSKKSHHWTGRRGKQCSALGFFILCLRQLVAVFASTNEDEGFHMALAAVFGLWSCWVAAAARQGGERLLLDGWAVSIFIVVVTALSALGYASKRPSDGCHLLTAAMCCSLLTLQDSPRHIPTVCFVIAIAWLVAAAVSGNDLEVWFTPVTLLLIAQAALASSVVFNNSYPVYVAALPASEAVLPPAALPPGRAGDYNHPVTPRNSRPGGSLVRRASFIDDHTLDQHDPQRKSGIARSHAGESRKSSTFLVKPLDTRDARSSEDTTPDTDVADDDDSSTSGSNTAPGQGMARSLSVSSPGGNLAPRTSVSSAASSHATSYVSFVAALNRRGEGGGVGFSLKRASQGSQVSIASMVPEDALDDAESFQKLSFGGGGHRMSFGTGCQEQTSTGNSKRKRGHTHTRPTPQNTRPARSATTVRARTPNAIGSNAFSNLPPVAPNPPPPSASTPSLQLPQPTGSLKRPAKSDSKGDSKSGGKQDSGDHLGEGGKLAHATSLRVPQLGRRDHDPSSGTRGNAREVTESTREIVRTVLDADFLRQQLGSPTNQSRPSYDGEHPGPIVPFRQLPATTLQKLVVLFGRLSEELDTFRAQQFIVACVCEILKCDRGAIFLAEWKRKEMWTITNEGHDIRVPMNKSLAGYAALHNRSLNIKDAQNDKRFNTDVDRRTGYVTRGVLVYPISRGLGYHSSSGNVGSEPIAVIQAINKLDGSGGGFTQDDEALLAMLGKQAGIHLYNSQVYGQLQLEGTKTKTLLEVSKEISEVNLDLGSMMTKIMTRARQVLLVERATIFLIDEEKQELWSALTDVETAEQLGGPGEAQGGMIRVPVGVGLAGHVAVTGENLNIEDAYDCTMFNPEYDRKTGFITRSILVVPIKPPHANKVMGVIQFINKTNNDPFFEDDEELATSFSSYVGVSLNNIILYEELREGKVVREQNKELQRLREMAEEAAESKSNFLMAMSHEIRTPMSGVIGMCELLANTPMTPEQQEMNDTIRNCGEALLAIINDVLDYGKIGSGKLELEQREFNVVAMLEETIDVIRSKTEAKSIVMTLEADPQLCPLVIGDNYRLRQVIINLVGNACKFTPEAGSIGVTVSPSAPEPSISGVRSPEEGDTMKVRFSVCDTGIGISQEAQKRLFQPFEQAEVGTTRQYGGTGLGLAICKQLVEAMSGQVGIVSELGKGTEFWFTASFAKPSSCITLSKQLLSAAPPMDGITLVLLVSHMKQRRILEGFCHLLGLKAFAVNHFDHLVKFVAAMPKTVPEKDHPVRQSNNTMPQARSRAAPQPNQAFVPNVILLDSTAEGATMDRIDQLLLQVKTIREQLPEADRPTHCHVALMMSMAKKVELGTSLCEQGASVVMAKPPKQQQLLKLFEAAVLGTQQNKGPSKGAAEEQRKDTGLKLLVAEDNPTNQLLIKKQLKGFGIVPTVCDNGQIAVDKLTEEHHDLVFMDCHMPVLDGYGACKKIRELEQSGTLGDRPRVTIVALTADALPQTRQVCLDHGMDDYATKPLRKAQLSAVLDKYWFKETT